MLISMVKPNERHLCDFTSFELIYVGGSAVPQTLNDALKVKNNNKNIYISKYQIYFSLK